MMDLHRELVDRANADLKQMGLEPNSSKRAWLGGRAQALLTVANAINDESPPLTELSAMLDSLLCKVAEAVTARGHGQDAYDIGKVAGLNWVRRRVRDDHDYPVRP